MKRSTVLLLIALVVTFCTLTNLSTSMAADDGFKSLFDGKTLCGWEGDSKLWRVEDGAITGETTADNPLERNTFLIWRGGEVDDFEIHFQYRIRNHNSGLQYRCWEQPGLVTGGYQADLVVDSPDSPWSGILYEERGRGIIATKGQKVVVGEDHKPKVVGSVGEVDDILAAIKKGEWNDYTVIVKGYKFIHIINGKQTVEVVDNDVEKRRRSGKLAFQLHAGPPMKVQFRNIQLKRLPK